MRTEMSSRPITTPEKTFRNCPNLHINRVPASIRITRSPDDQLHFAATGDAEDLSSIITTTAYDSLSITYRLTQRRQSGRSLFNLFGRRGKNFQSGNGNFSFSFSHGNTVVQNVSNVHGQNVIISGGDVIIQDFTPLVLNISAPLGTNIFYVDAPGASLEIADLSGNLDLRLYNPGTVNAECAHNLRACIEGNGDVRIGHIEGDIATLVINGSGDIHIGSGKCTDLIAIITGSGDIDANLTATNASLALQGSGDMHIGRVTNRLNQQCQGSGDITIG